MKFGASMFVTDYGMHPAELGAALEARGFDSLWVPEHSHIPVSRVSPFPAGGELPKKYYDCMDPFVALAAAGAATQTLLLGTGICLIAQRDPIQTAKLAASLDQVSAGRFLFGVGNGWNQDEMENHGTAYASRHKRARETVEAMKAIWTQDAAEYHGEFVDFGPMAAWPKPTRQPHPPIYVGGAFPWSARRAIRYGEGWLPQAARAGHYRQIADMIPEFHRMARAAGRDPASIAITVWHARRDPDLMKRYQDLGVERVVFSIEPEATDAVTARIDAIAEVMHSFHN